MRARSCLAAVLFSVGIAVPAGSASAQPYGQQTGSLTLSETTVNPGQVVTAIGRGFRPLGSVDMSFESAPVGLGNFQADASGVVSARVTVPSGATPGAHQVIATGPAPDNATLVLRAGVTVRAPAGAGSSLVRTGSSSVVPLVTVGILLILVGATAWFLVRRRRRVAA